MEETLSQGRLDVATPERVAIDLPIAGIGYRSLAYLVDLGVICAFWCVLLFVGTLTSKLFEGIAALSGVMQALLVLAVFATQWLFWTCLEGLWEGQTIGKRLVGIHVVREDGAPIGLFEAAVRNLARMLDFLPSFYITGVCFLLFTRSNRRIGDLLAGTVVVRKVAASLDRYQAPPAHASGAPSLAAKEAELILDFLEREKTLEPAARNALRRRLIDRFGAHLDPTERTRLLASDQEADSFLRARAGGEV